MEPATSIPAMPRRLVRLRIDGMECAACVGRIERVVRRLPGVDDIHVDLLSAAGEVSFDGALIDAQRVADAVSAIGFPTQTVSEDDPQGATGVDDVARRRALFWLILAGAGCLPLMAAMVGVSRLWSTTGGAVRRSNSAPRSPPVSSTPSDSFCPI